MSSQSTQRIMKLDESVVNRIAAGEVVQRPANAMKEMLENSLDAGSTSITVSCKAGGIKLLQIQDNGSGIKPEDFGLLCERFATSKLRSFEDLSSISTFGFRGEALASISHVAHLRVISMTADSGCAYKASYEDGKMVGPQQQPTPCAGVKGTTITVEDLFYNTPLRLKAMRNPSDEYQKIIEVMTKYALHNSGVAIVCKKHGENTTDVHTAKGATVPDNIKVLYGHAVSRELIHAETKDETYGLTDFRAWFTNPNFNLKKTTFIIFINNRLVECAPLKKAIDGLYSQYLPKGSHPWVYMSLQIKPQNIDVNVHPTKSEVRFLYESNIIECVQKLFTQKLEEHNTSRTFSVAGNVISGTALQSPAKAKSLGRTGTQSPFSLSSIGSHSQSFTVGVGSGGGSGISSSQKLKASHGYVSQSKMVRVDPTVRTLDAFLSPNTAAAKSSAKKSGDYGDEENEGNGDGELVRTNPSTPMKSEKSGSRVGPNDDEGDSEMGTNEDEDEGSKKRKREAEDEDVQRFSQIASMSTEDDGGVWNKRRRMALDDNEDVVGNFGEDEELKYRPAKRPNNAPSSNDRDPYYSPKRRESCKILSYGGRKSETRTLVNYDDNNDDTAAITATGLNGTKRCYDGEDDDNGNAPQDPFEELPSTQRDNSLKNRLRSRSSANKKEEEEEEGNNGKDEDNEKDGENRENPDDDYDDEDGEDINIKLPRRRPRRFKACPLTSVVTQIDTFERKSHKGLEGILSNCVFVGFADTSFVVLQERTGLYICNVLTLIQEMFFQQAYMRFQNFERIVLKPPLGLRDMLKEAEKTPCLSKLESPVDLDWCCSTIMRMREMLNEYFSIEIDEDGSIRALPQIVDGFVPDMIYLPLFVYGLATKVEWQYEHECFETIARQLSEFYVPRPPNPQAQSQVQEGSAGSEGSADKSSWKKTIQTYEWTIQHVLFPNVRTLLYPPTSYASDGTFVQIAALENLYKVFERC